MKNKQNLGKILVSIGFVFALFMVAAPTIKASAETSAIIYQTTTSLNVRSAPGTSGRILTFAEKGANITISKTKIVGKTTWGYGTVDKKSGWLSMKYLEKVTSNTEAKKELKPTYVNDILIVNKEYHLPSTYAPGESTEARGSFKKMVSKAKQEGFNLTAFSTYRSYTYQKGIFDRYAKSNGVEAANRFSARAGESEHQTGLAFDVGEVGKESQWVSQKFGDTSAGIWIATHAHNFGFIIRYPEEKESITGYIYEPWHLRYLGKDVATKVYTSGLTLEEYLGVY